MKEITKINDGHGRDGNEEREAVKKFDYILIKILKINNKKQTF